MKKPAVFFLLVIAPAFAICLALLGLETLKSNILGWILLGLGIAFPAGGIIYFFIRHEPFWKAANGGEAVREEKGDRSFWLILPGFLAAHFLPPIEWMALPAALPRILGMQVAGLIIVVAGIGLLVWARAHIRGLYSGHVEVQSDHQLVQSGPYHFVRHPAYTGYLLFALGLSIGYASWLGLLSIPLLLIPGLAYRILVEERLLSSWFGDEFKLYKGRTKKLIPGIW